MGGTGIVSCTALDAAIDLSHHDHAGFAFRQGGVPTKALFGAAAALGVATVVSAFVPHANRRHEQIESAFYGAAIAYGATYVWRNGYGLAMSPLRPLHPNLGDVVGNAVNRSHMMSQHPDRKSWPLLWPVFDGVSRLQGHGPIDKRVFEIPRPWPR